MQAAENTPTPQKVTLPTGSFTTWLEKQARHTQQLIEQAKVPKPSAQEVEERRVAQRRR